MAAGEKKKKVVKKKVAKDAGGDEPEDSIERRRREREARRVKREEEMAKLEAGEASKAGEDSSERRRREREEARKKRLADEDEKAKQLVTPAKKPLGGRKAKDDDDSDDSHEEDFNPNLKVAAEDEESDEEDSEETKRKKAEQRKLEAAKSAAGGGGGGNIFERINAGEDDTFTVQGAAMISAMAGGKTKDLSKYMAAADEDEDEKSVEDTGKAYMVNPLLFGREDRSDEYGQIFGRDLEWFPDGLRVWRMEKFLPKPVPVQQYGKFLTRETYMILNITEEDDGAKHCVISYWLGSETTMDKSGGAAFRIGELAGYLAAMSRANEIHCKFKQFRVEEGEEPDEVNCFALCVVVLLF